MKSYKKAPKQHLSFLLVKGAMTIFFNLLNFQFATFLDLCIIPFSKRTHSLYKSFYLMVKIQAIPWCVSNLGMAKFGSRSECRCIWIWIEILISGSASRFVKIYADPDAGNIHPNCGRIFWISGSQTLKFIN